MEINPSIVFVHHSAVLTAKAQNESSACGSVVTYESTTVSAVRSLAMDGSEVLVEHQGRSVAQAVKRSPPTAGVASRLIHVGPMVDETECMFSSGFLPFFLTTHFIPQFLHAHLISLHQPLNVQTKKINKIITINKKNLLK